MSYPIRNDLKRYAWIRMPVRPAILRIANALMPVVQKGRPLDRRLQSEEVALPNCHARLIRPRTEEPLPLLLYFHGGAFLMKAAAYHKDLAQQYALEAGCAVMFPDHRLAPKDPFPAAVEDGLSAYVWALEHLTFPKLAVGGDSAGAPLALAVTRLALEQGLRTPDLQMLIYPVADARMDTPSMQRYTDTPLWNAVLNKKAWDLYVSPEDRHDPLASPLEAESFRGFPPTYIETAEYDCLHDEGIELARRLQEEGAPVTLVETTGTMHGFDIAEKSPYVQRCVARRITFLRDGLRPH